MERDTSRLYALIMNDRAVKLHAVARSGMLAALTLLTVACTTPTPPKSPGTHEPVRASEPAASPASAEPAVPAVTPQAKAPPTAPDVPSAAIYRKSSWGELPGWREDDVSAAWSAFIASCNALKSREHWTQPCSAATQVRSPSRAVARAFLEQHFTPYRISSRQSGDEGLITGYYEPLLRGSRTRSERYRHPVYGVPDDLVVVELADVYPQIKTMRLRGRLEGRRLVPYPDRAQIESGHDSLIGKEIAWVDDALDLFFLQIQGSGRILLDTGDTMRVGYADQNGHPYRSIGRVLVERGELTLEQASMQSIKAWGRSHPDELDRLLDTNASYVFFRELPPSPGGPPGSLGVPLTGGRSVAVDRTHVPLGAPVYIATTWPNTARPLNRLMLAQDTGGAIRGPVRADFFWGHGEGAAREAGAMKQRLRMWVLLPNAYPVPSAGE